jgi:D-aminopeptidase
MIETPILITNTLSVGTVSDACVRYLVEHNPGIGDQHDVVIPVVGECDDSFLHDAIGRHIRSEHVYQAIERAAAGRVPEGAVGAGTGMVCCDFKAGIGTASRRIPSSVGGVASDSDYTLGVLVLSNFGVRNNLRIDGVPVGELLETEFDEYKKRTYSYGSIIVVVATDAPLLSIQLSRVCKRAALGIGRCGSYAAHGSGEIVIGFSTANRVSRESTDRVHKLEFLPDESLGSHYEAVIEATEEAIINSLCMAGEMVGQGGNTAPGLPLDKILELMKKYRPQRVSGELSGVSGASLGSISATPEPDQSQIDPARGLRPRPGLGGGDVDRQQVAGVEEVVHQRADQGGEHAHRRDLATRVRAQPEGAQATGQAVDDRLHHVHA